MMAQKSVLAGQGRPLLYLDFDGVLHPMLVLRTRKGPQLGPGLQQHRLFEHVQRLDAALMPFPEIQIVLSTSWVKVYGFDRARSLLGPLQSRVVGATFHSRMPRAEFEAMSRGLQIYADVLRRKPSSWLALDDDYQDWPAWCRDRLVLTDSQLGLTHPTAWRRLLRQLTEISPPSP